MAFSYTEQTGDGVTTVFPFSFSGADIGYIRESDIVALVNGIETEDFTFSGTNQIQFNVAPPAPVAPWVGPNIMIRRVVPKDRPYADFSRGNNFGQEQMNYTVLQQLYALHEFLDGFLPEGYFVKGDMDFKGNSLKNIGDLDMQGHQILGLPVPYEGGSPVRKQEYDMLSTSLYGLLGGGGSTFQQWVDVRTFMDGQGGRPSLEDWVADNTLEVTTAVQAALDAALNVNFPPGTFVVGKLTVRSYHVLSGSGRDQTIMKRKAGSTDSTLYYAGDDSHRLEGLLVERLTLDGVSASGTGAGVDINYFGRAYVLDGGSLSQGACTISHCTIKNYAYGGHVQHGDQFHFESCNVHHNGKGIWADNSANLMIATRCSIHHNTNEGVLISNVSSNCTVFGCYINDNPGYGVRVYIAEQPSILFCAFNRNGYKEWSRYKTYSAGEKVTPGCGATSYVALQGGNINHQPGIPGSEEWWDTSTGDLCNAVYLHGISGYVTEAVTIQGCLFGSNSGIQYDIAGTYVTTCNLDNNYFYNNTTEGKLARIRLSTACYGFKITGSRWKTATVSECPKVLAVAGSTYTFDDSGDATSPSVTVVGIAGSSSLIPGYGSLVPTSVATPVAGVLDLSANESVLVSVPALSGNVTSILFPSSPLDGQDLYLRFKQAGVGVGPFTVFGWPASVVLEAETFYISNKADASTLLHFKYSSSSGRWYESGRMVQGRRYYMGTDTNDSGPVGAIGECQSSNNAVALTDNVGADVATISLTAGDWDVYGHVDYDLSAATFLKAFSGASTVSATLGAAGTHAQLPLAITGTDTITHTIPCTRLQLTATTTVFMVAKAHFTAGTVTARGYITARRRR